MTNNIRIIKGYLVEPLDVAEFPIDGKADAIIIHLEPGEIPETPIMHRIEPIDDNVMNIRKEPVIGNNVIGKLVEATEAIQELESGSNVWVKIGYQQWVARIYNGKVYCAYID